MVFSTASKNFTNNVKSKPPLVVFTVCILGIIVTTFSLAYYVHSHYKILNVDAKDDWLSILKYINTLDFCLQNTTAPPKTRDNIETITITTTAKLTVSSASGPLNIRGILNLDDWARKCPDEVDVPSLIIEFSLPKIEQNSSKDVCVKLTGPRSFMPKLSEQEVCEPVVPNPKKWAKLTLKSSDIEEQGFCTDGLLSQLEYDINYSRNLKYDMFLSQEDRLIINSHLIVTSCFLVCVVLLITCYALLKKKSITNTNESKQYLMAKGMYL